MPTSLSFWSFSLFLVDCYQNYQSLSQYETISAAANCPSKTKPNKALFGLWLQHIDIIPTEKPLGFHLNYQNTLLIHWYHPTSVTRMTLLPSSWNWILGSLQSQQKFQGRFGLCLHDSRPGWSVVCGCKLMMNIRVKGGLDRWTMWGTWQLAIS